MPAEWEPHASTWLVWPENQTTWSGKLLKEVESIYLQMVLALLPNERVNLLVQDKTAAKKISGLFPKKTATRNLTFHFVKTVDVWIRDYGPIFIRQHLPAGQAGTADSRRQTKAFVKWEFNAWGGKYTDFLCDNEVVDNIQALKKKRRFDPGMILEGGSIDVNGRGTCLTTEQCLLNTNRNPQLSKKEIEGYLKDWLGITKVVWLKEGIEGDDTDGHVDDITRFVSPNTILSAVEPNTRDKNHEILKKNLEVLRQSKDQENKPFRLIELPMPGRAEARGHEGTRLPASYANFYIANEVVLVPIYSHSNDKLALKIISEVFPARKVIGIECTSLVHGLGSIHCVTQQELY